MKFFLVLMCFFGGLASAAETPKDLSVTIDGVTYYKGFIKKHKRGAVYYKPAPRTDLPPSYDAQTAGKATPIKMPGQGSCGDCWAFSRTGALESASILAGTPSPFQSLSEEDTTDNASDENGCGGGSMDFNYEISHGVASLTTCPWEGGGGGCNSNPVAVQAYKMAYIGDTNGPTDAEMQAAIYQFGDVSVTVAAGGNFNTDSGSDRMTSCGARAIDHMVSLTGYRPVAGGSGVEYKMKNSWGTSWGANGYAYMALGCDNIASGDQSAMVVYVQSVNPPPPVIDLQLPIEILAAAGQEVPIQVPAPSTGNATLGWSDGEAGPVIWVKPTQTTSYTLTAADAKGNKTSATVTVIVSSSTKG
jgi:hypothetical protein